MSISIGLDISKDKIDVFAEGKHREVANTKEAIIDYFDAQDRTSCIVMEATGKYHRLAHRVLVGLGFKVMVVNPYQSKHFAKAMNLLCKTDKVDAKVLSAFAERMEFKETCCASENEEKMQDLSRHLDDLKKLRKELTQRGKESKGFIKASLDATITTIDAEIDKTESKLKSIICGDEQLTRKFKLLLTIPGIGESTAISLLSYLRELGLVTKQQISALSGLAPMNNDSGLFKGKRRIRGGRHDVRTHLYMPILGAATQHNARLKVFYDKLVDSGKPKKVALTACMRKLLVWANAVLMTGQPWNANYA